MIMGSGLRRRMGSIVGLSVVASLLLVWAAGPAAAHSVLLATSPAESSRVASAPSSVVLTFNEQPRGEYSDIHIVGPDNARRDSGHVKVLNDTVTENLGGTRPAGTYVVDWRVISADGHPVSGQFSFTAAAAGAQLAARQADTTATTAEKKSSSSAVLIVVVVAALLVGVGVVVFFVLRRRQPVGVGGRSRRADDEDE